MRERFPEMSVSINTKEVAGQKESLSCVSRTDKKGQRLALSHAVYPCGDGFVMSGMGRFPMDPNLPKPSEVEAMALGYVSVAKTS